MSNQDRGAGAAVGFGVGFLIAGTALLMQELDLLTLRWSLLLPLIVMLTGVAVVFSGLMGAHRSRPSASTQISDPTQNDPTALTL